VIGLSWLIYLAGLAVYVSLMIWLASRRRVIWAILLTLPTLLGLVASVFSRPSEVGGNWLLAHMPSLAVAQILVGLAVYLIGSRRAEGHTRPNRN
jgi:hypothetical protein